MRGKNPNLDMKSKISVFINREMESGIKEKRSKKYGERTLEELKDKRRSSASLAHLQL